MSVSLSTDRVPSIARLVVGVAIAGFLALGTHVGLQQVLGVSFPDFHLVPLWAMLLSKWSVWAAVIAIWLHDQRQAPKRTWLGRWLLISLIYLLVKETLRAAIMTGVVTTSYGLSLALAVPAIVAGIVGCGLSGLVARYAKGPAAIVLGGLAVALFTELVWQRFVTTPWIDVINGLGLPNHAEVYPPPYGWHVLSRAFATYIEPVIGAILFCRMIGPRFATAVTIYLFMTGRVVAPLVWIFFEPFPLPVAFMSTFQFTLENLVLVVGVFLSLRWSRFLCRSELARDPA